MNKLLVATAKGLVDYEIEGPSTKWKTVHFPGYNVTSLYHDPVNDRLWVGISHKHWGQKLHFSNDHGKSWSETGLPQLRGLTLQNGKPAKLRQVWCFRQGGESDPGRLWMGTDPGALFLSEDHGSSFNLVEPLWNHSSRQTKGQWFGAGSDFPFIHTIIVDPNNHNHILVAVSCAGVFESWDCGSSWNPKNNGLIAAYLPNPNVEVGHDPHTVYMSSTNNQILWQQNHCGIFNSVDGGDVWRLMSKQDSIPHYGFAMTINEENPDQAWVIPVTSDEQRIAPDLRLRVFKTSDFGQSWMDDSEGLPTTPSFDIVLRQAFDKKGDIQVFGTTNGNLFLRTIGDTWQTISAHLTKVNTVILV